MVANGPYHMMIELLNTTNGKKRLVSLKNRNEMELFIRLFNLISSYRKYELLFNDGRLGRAAARPTRRPSSPRRRGA